MTEDRAGDTADDPDAPPAGLPPGLVAYKRTPEFDQDTLPAGLRRAHSTKDGAWALIHVLEGRLIYRIIDPPAETLLTPGRSGVIRPRQLHEVAPDGPMRMFVEFYAAPPDRLAD